MPQDADGFSEGYGRTQQDVLIPAFLSAYGLFNVNSVETSPFPRVPLPNWRVNYDGIGKIPAVKFARNVPWVMPTDRRIASVASLQTCNLRPLV